MHVLDIKYVEHYQSWVENTTRHTLEYLKESYKYCNTQYLG